jgi:MSHA pilin protein MshD
MSSRRRALGMSLIEVVLFIVVLSIGVAGIAMLYNQLTVASVDPMVRKQALSVAASLMEEIQLRGFTYCDPDDANVHVHPTPACTTLEGIGVEGGETRYADPRFDNVNDYHGFSMSGANIRDVTNTQISSLGAYSVSVTVAAAGTDFPDVADINDGLRITVAVTGPAGVSVSLQGYRLRYAPNTP